MSAIVDMDRVAAAIIEVAATEVMPRFMKLAAGDIREKGPGDFVTVADEAAEAALAPRLLDLLPGAVLLGEEAAAADPGLIARLSAAAPVWVIDPIDGTANFAEGRPVFAVMVALVEDDVVRASWIHDPVAGRTASASTGAGAWIDGRRLRVSQPPNDIAAMRGSLLAGFFGRPELGRRIQARRNRVTAIKSLRCAGHEYMRLAAGELDFSLFTKLMPWDHAPGVLLHAEAGGYAAYLDGGGFRPGRIDAGALLLAPDAASWQRLHDTLLGEEPGDRTHGGGAGHERQG
jgi:fructose-1,6-bisphosphatase/inositol monophosphatase family enzyme